MRIPPMRRPFVTFTRLDVLVDNAGTAIPKPFMDTTLEEMDQVIDLNLRGVFIATHAALKQMLAGGRIITIGALRGRAHDDARPGGYTASACKDVHTSLGP